MRKLSALICGFTLFLSTLSGAATPEPAAYSLASVHAGSIATFEGSNIPGVNWHRVSWYASWAPWVHIGRGVKLRAELGISMLGKVYTGTFTALNYEALVVMPFIGKLFAEAGGGYQTWVNYGDSHATVTAALGYDFTGSSIPLLSRVSVAYSRFFKTGSEVDIIKGTVGFTVD